VKKLNIKQHDPVDEKGDNDRQDKLNDLARTTFRSSKLEKYSNKLLITNIPKTITVEELRELFPGHEKIDLKQTPSTRAYITYSSAKEAMNMRMSLKPVIAREKYRVIVLLLNSDKAKKSSKAGSFIKRPTGRYFESSIE
jgi:RNA recognition motif-containing protein